MELFHGIDKFHYTGCLSVTVGTFDGVHLGHQRIIQRLMQSAKKNDCRTLLLTFDPHPRKVLYPEQEKLKLLTTTREKVELLDALHLDFLVVQPFDLKFSRLAPLAFVQDFLLKKMQIKHLVMGWNHKFGHDRAGRYEDLKIISSAARFDVEQVPAYHISGREVSSTKIRDELFSGETLNASNMLGRDYFLTGTVREGDGLGNKIGFPTANVQIAEEDKLLPKDGVYAVLVEVGHSTHLGMLNIGFKPTVSHLMKRSIEVHIFNYKRMIYGKKIRILLKDRIRDEMKFHDINQLALQIAKDKKIVLNKLQHIHV